MKLHLTGYKQNAPKTATRLVVKEHYNLHQLIARRVKDLTDAEFDQMVQTLAEFKADAVGEHQAVYFWVTE
jgi:hypothetical protein